MVYLKNAIKNCYLFFFEKIFYICILFFIIHTWWFLFFACVMMPAGLIDALLHKIMMMTKSIYKMFYYNWGNEVNEENKENITDE